jgi:hypothetical protein
MFGKISLDGKSTGNLFKKEPSKQPVEVREKDGAKSKFIKKEKKSHLKNDKKVGSFIKS